MLILSCLWLLLPLGPCLGSSLGLFSLGHWSAWFCVSNGLLGLVATVRSALVIDSGFRVGLRASVVAYEEATLFVACFSAAAMVWFSNLFSLCCCLLSLGDQDEYTEFLILSRTPHAPIFVLLTVIQ
jgi:hypothetical protein